MRNTIITLLAATSVLSAYAHPVSPGEAKTIAAEFFNSGSGPRHKVKAVDIPADGSVKDVQPYYIFNAEGNNGFVIVAGDTRAKKILGYSEKGSFDKDKIPPQLKWLLSQYQKSLDSIPVNAPKPCQNVSRSDEQSYLLTTQWGQSDPYNAKCPIIDGNTAMTGCVATAMAQIINYEKVNSHVSEIPEYWCSVWMPALPARDFNFGNLDNEGIADLMLYCGQSVHMNYGAFESGAPSEDVPEALRNYFGWSHNVNLLNRENYNDDHWNRMVQEEISKGHPLYYSAINEEFGGHAFVIDGVSDDLFHVNWGWYGSADGYYSFQPFATDHASAYTLMQQMVALRDDDYSAETISYGNTIDGINYQLNDDLTAAVLQLKDGNKYHGDLVIPSYITYEGQTYTVNYFGPNAFKNCRHLESISIPATIIGQEWSIFDGCENLHKVNVEDMAAFIRLDIGAWWTGSPLTYGADLYLNGELVKDLIIPEGIERVGYCKFDNCWSIETITMPSTMKASGQSSFSNCPKLRQVDMSCSSIEVIGIGSFNGDVSIKEITLPTTVNTLQTDAFRGCTSLRKIVLSPTAPPNCPDHVFEEYHHSETIVYVPDEAVEDYRQAKEWCDFSDIRPLSEEKPIPATDDIVVNNLRYLLNQDEQSATLIGHEDVDFPDGVRIPAAVDYAGLTYPVTATGFKSFIYKTIAGIEAPLEKVGIYSFWGCDFNSSLVLPSSLTRISDKAFYGSKMPRLVLPKGLSSIGKQVFGFAEDWIEGEMVYLKSIDEIESHNPVPPVISEESFDPATYEQTLLKVPYGSRKAYAAAPGWRNFANISTIGEEQEPIREYDLMLSADLADISPIREKMPLIISAKVINMGTKDIDGLILSWQIDGIPAGEKYYETTIHPSEAISLEEKIIPSLESAGQHELKLLITGDNIDEMDVTDNEVILTFVSFDKGYYRVSLLEQYTSESCSLTPYYAPQIEEAIRNSGKKEYLAQVTHHCGFYDDFLTLNHDYEWFYNDYGTYTPAIMINRTDISDTGYTPVFGFSDNLDTQIINQSGICDALVSVYCEVEGNEVIVKTLLEKDTDFNLENGYDYITVFLLEDSIPAREQIDMWSDGYVENYYHRNTLRKVLTGTWGDKIEWRDNMCAIKFTSAIDPEWNPEKLTAVAFIHRYNPESQVECQVYTANSSTLPQYGSDIDDSSFITTSDYSIINQGERFDIYTVTGIRVKSNASDLNNLTPGIYICNGKKAVVK